MQTDSEGDPVDRSRSAAHGRYAQRVFDIPAAGWRDILARVTRRVREHRLSLIAGGVSFFLVLSIFPALAATVSLFGLLADPATLEEQLRALDGVLPAPAIDLLGTNLARFVTTGDGRLGLGFALGLVVTFWIANAGLKAFFTALNVVYDEEEKRSFVRFNLASFRAAIALFVVAMVMIGATIAAPVLFGLVGLDATAGRAVAIIRWPLLLLTATVSLMIVYRIGPSRKSPRWRWLALGSFLTALAWLAVSGAFSFYLAHFGNYDLAYGSLGAVIGFMLWIFVSVFVLLLGAEFNAELEHQLVTDTTVGRPREMGRRGAYKADHLGSLRSRRRTGENARSRR